MEQFLNVLNCLGPEVRNTRIEVNEQLPMISTSEIIVPEFRQAINQLKNHRSPDEDLITGEMLKALGENGLAKLTSFLKSVWFNETIQPLEASDYCPKTEEGQS